MAQSPHQREGWLSVNSPWHWDTACVRPAFPSLCQRKRIKLSRKTTSKTMWFWQVKGVFLLLGRPSLSSDKLEHQSCSPWGVSHWAGVWCCLLPLLPSIPSCSASAAWGGAADQIRKFLKYSMVWKIEGGKKGLSLWWWWWWGFRLWDCNALRPATKYCRDSKHMLGDVEGAPRVIKAQEKGSVNTKSHCWLSETCERTEDGNLALSHLHWSVTCCVV